MLSKCANPACSAQFRYLHQGKIFQLSPTPEVDAITGGMFEQFYERFWLCEKCCKEMRVGWDGTKAAVVPLAVKSADAQPDFGDETKCASVIPDPLGKTSD